MSGFWIAAALLLALATAFTMVPLWRRRRSEGRWSATALAASVAVLPLAIALYLQVTTWQPPAAGADGEASVVQMVEALRSRLAANPGDPAGWRLLGRSYMALGQYPLAAEAFTEAWQRTAAPDVDLKLAYGEAQALADRSTLSGAAGRLFEEVLAVEPENPKALWYGGLAALETQQPETARERWARLLELGPPEPVAEVLRQQLARLSGEQPAVASSGRADASAEPFSVNVDIRVGEEVSLERFGAEAALFLFARAPEGGPPIAVIRGRVDALPGKFTLSDANAMMAGRSLASFDELVFVARVSASGQPVAQPGDVFGEQRYAPGTDPHEVEIVLDQIVE